MVLKVKASSNMHDTDSEPLTPPIRHVSCNLFFGASCVPKISYALDEARMAIETYYGADHPVYVLCGDQPWTWDGYRGGPLILECEHLGQFGLDVIDRILSPHSVHINRTPPLPPTQALWEDVWIVCDQYPKADPTDSGQSRSIKNIMRSITRFVQFNADGTQIEWPMMSWGCGGGCGDCWGPDTPLYAYRSISARI